MSDSPTPQLHQKTGKKQAWIDALRLRSLPFAASGTIIAAGIAAQHEKFNPLVFVLMISTALLLQIVSNFADEYGDLEQGVDDENRIGPIRGMQRGDISKDEMKRAIIIASTLGFAAGIALLVVGLGPDNLPASLLLVGVGLAALAAAIFYTMGDKPYGYIALGDIFSFFFFGIVAVGAGSFIFLDRFEPLTLIPAIALGLPVAGMLNLNNMRDAENDRLKGKTTVANLLGDKKSRMYHAALLIISMILFGIYPHFSGIHDPLAYYYVLGFMPLIKNIKDVFAVNEPREFDRHMKPLSMGTVMLSILFASSLAIFGG